MTLDSGNPTLLGSQCSQSWAVHSVDWAAGSRGVLICCSWLEKLVTCGMWSESTTLPTPETWASRHFLNVCVYTILVISGCVHLYNPSDSGTDPGLGKVEER